MKEETQIGDCKLDINDENYDEIEDFTNHDTIDNDSIEDDTIFIKHEPEHQSNFLVDKDLNALQARN